ncbi:MAG: KH domain-containing protein [Candidatus Acidiferrum sp.]
MHSPFDPLEELLAEIAKTLVDHPEEVQVHAVRGRAVTVLELRVHPKDTGKVIGRQGHTAHAIRIILGAAGMKLQKYVTVEILE